MLKQGLPISTILRIYTKNSSKSSNIVFIIFDASVKNNITTSISHIWRKHNIIMKSVHHTMNVSSTEVEIFDIRCGIS